MKTLYSILFLLTASLFTRAQALVIDSTRFITGYECCTQIRYAIPTKDKGILFVGGDSGNPGGIIPYFVTDTGVNGNVLIGKIDSNQKISWIKVYGGTQEDLGYSVCQTPDGGYAVLAYTESDDGNVTGFLGTADVWLLRIDEYGNLLWEKCYGSPDDEIPISIANTPDHGFIILGSSNGSGDDVPFHYGTMWDFDWIVIKTDSIGNMQWCKDLGTSNDEGQTGAILSIDSSYYLISNTGSLDHDCTDTAWHPGVPTTGFDLYILKLDDTGKVLWDSSYGGSGTDGANAAFFDTRDSTIMINGFTYSGNYMVTGYQGSGDMWVVKVNKNGTLLWEKTLGSPEQENGTGICAIQSGGYMAYGSTFRGPIGNEDCWLFVLDALGDTITSKLFGGIDNEYPYSIVPYLNSYAATGSSISATFTEGSTYGNFADGGCFVSYIDSETLAVNNINKRQTHLLVYPNPSFGSVKIVMPDNEPAFISIFNSIGKTIYLEEVKHAIYNDVNCGEWANGLYIIKWQGDDGTVQTAKFIKE